MGDKSTSAAALLVGTVAVGALTYKVAKSDDGLRSSSAKQVGTVAGSKLMPAKAQSKKIIPPGLERRGVKWLELATGGMAGVIDPVPKVSVCFVVFRVSSDCAQLNFFSFLVPYLFRLYEHWA